MTDAAFTAIAGMLHARSGLALGPEKLYLLETRLAPLMAREGCAGLRDLAPRLRPGSPLEREVVEAMTTNESLFFRDSKPFDLLRRTLPRLHAERSPGIPLRIWSAAASTGQEAYSIAMITKELALSLGGRQIDIVGTDISQDALRRAREGSYSQFEIQRGLPVAMLVRHFEKRDAAWLVKPDLRQAVRFQHHNLLDDPRPLGRFDIVFCRNVLIYFDTNTKSRVLATIARQMAPDGLLCLGGAETILGVSDAFRALPGETGAYTPAPTAQAA